MDSNQKLFTDGEAKTKCHISDSVNGILNSGVTDIDQIFKFGASSTSLPFRVIERICYRWIHEIVYFFSNIQPGIRTEHIS